MKSSARLSVECLPVKKKGNKSKNNILSRKPKSWDDDECAE